MALEDEGHSGTQLGVAPTNGSSHVLGAQEPPLLELTIPELLVQTAARFPNHVAAIFEAQGIRWTYRDLIREVDALAGGLLQLGLKPGDRVGVWAPNCAEWLLAQFATARLGIILVNVNPAYRPFELSYALKKTGCTALILAAQFKNSDYVAMLSEVVPEIAASDPGALHAAELPDLRAVIVTEAEAPDGMIAFPDLIAKGRAVVAKDLDAITRKLDCHDPINIQFTSGTTGLPKGATLTHRNIVNNAASVTSAIKLIEQDMLCIPVPFYHCFGMVMGTLGCVTKGAAIVVPGPGFDPITTLDTVSKHRCTALYGVPTMFVGMLEHPRFAEYDLSSLRTGIMAGAPCPIEIMRQVQSRMHMSEVTIAYGMTETSPVSFQSATDDPVQKRVSSVGRIQPHVEVKIVDEDSVVVPVGAQGELLTRGYSVMQGYWDEPDKTAEAIDADGWMHTGDLATLDVDGFCKITGRVKDMIVRGGENVYPREIEEFLYTHPAISQVQVFGIPDQKFGEIVVAWLVAKPGADPTEAEILDFCRDSIAHFKVPAMVRFKNSLPMTVTGKPQKFIMRAQMVEELGLEEIETA
ncbi:acyl-CoA synthetase (AMP-forming)/AMP-acid ligase II [Dinoroseobacter shibae DFL 12 = DSM 16493]|jgi:fatty-acyl-CoA synthase|uniref:3-methylmercaptopropionyl-CoA ligase n=1 Tax=Dinoroseobacter shibae (strain DSM 16493 / NCIMB 14021 / DFL 12) TaxID=398580 RepID=A8LP71_DINSH|nr:AMP-binding protein [Dinoroseobacter shibae]ABV95136.1 acyl-CoA synthetase (AMP-forming)/AMP-acid ligase II [Dinoroseobacter shibae DFL 12 = DSM 16493]URF46550.1 AMP-binding protein [Dinoroseobacter shibae]URF50856.1 AMP-binding protein [Dinoroseobacter shibae]